jgi:hypothetical protein
MTADFDDEGQIDFAGQNRCQNFDNKMMQIITTNIPHCESMQLHAILARRHRVIHANEILCRRL